MSIAWLKEGGTDDAAGSDGSQIYYAKFSYQKFKFSKICCVWHVWRPYEIF